MQPVRSIGGVLLPALPRCDRSGFSLIELAICLVLMGVMSGFVVQVSAGQRGQQCWMDTAQQLPAIQQALEDYAAAKGRFPRPAAQGVGPHDGAYGSEVATVDSTILTTGTGPNRVLIGVVPHNTLGLHSAMAEDCWGNKITYAVSESYTITSLYADPNLQGVITVKQGTLAAPKLVSATVGYVVVSHGAEALGAVPASYTGPPRTCNGAQADASVTRIDKENCDDANAVYFASASNAGTIDADFFDDQIVFGGNPPIPPGSCASQTVSWGTHCSGTAMITLLGLSVNITNTAPGYTGLALSTCNAGIRQTVGLACLPIGACETTNPRTGNPLLLLTGIGMNFGTGVCKKYACCNGSVSITPLSPCLLPVDLPGLSISCP